MTTQTLLTAMLLVAARAVFAQSPPSPPTKPSVSPTNQTSSLTTEQRLSAAVLPLPAALRAGATVTESSPSGTPTVLRNGTNGYVCSAPAAADTTLALDCWHAEFAPIARRFAELEAKGINGDSARQEIEKEIRAGKLKTPTRPAVSYRMWGPISAYDVAADTARTGMEVWEMVHTPFRTGEELGLPTKAVVGTTAPYVMGSGTFVSHIMILHTPATP